MSHFKVLENISSSSKKARFLLHTFLKKCDEIKIINPESFSTQKTSCEIYPKSL